VEAGPSESCDVFLVSFPKCGRTWLRLLIGKALAVHFGEGDGNEVLELEPLTARLPGVPRIRVTHHDDPQKKAPEDLSADKGAFRGKRVIFLVRDPRDVVVSMYFQNKCRVKKAFVAQEDLADAARFVHSRVGSLETILAYYKIWARERHVPAGFLLVRYEDLHSDPAATLRRVFDFLGLPSVGDDALDRAIEYCRFDNMRRMEVEGHFQSARLKTRNPSDPDSFKTRRGEVGAYREYLDPETLSYLDGRVASDMPPLFGYQ
jgi:hypothetical protein